MTITIRSQRLARGMTVKELAARLNVTAGAISQLERSEWEETIKLSSLLEAHRAMGSDLRITAAAHQSSAIAPFRVADALSKALAVEKDPVFALRLLTQSIRDGEALGELPRHDWEVAPTPLPDRGWDTLFRALYARTIPDAERPSWMAAEPLPQPWFVSQYPVLRERALRNTSDDLRALNIFIDERSLERA